MLAQGKARTDADPTFHDKDSLDLCGHKNLLCLFCISCQRQPTQYALLIPYRVQTIPFVKCMWRSNVNNVDRVVLIYLFIGRVYGNDGNTVVRSPGLLRRSMKPLLERCALTHQLKRRWRAPR